MPFHACNAGMFSSLLTLLFLPHTPLKQSAGPPSRSLLAPSTLPANLHQQLFSLCSHPCTHAGIPAMSMNIRDQARRFITLIDELYNARVLLVCTAALPPDQLFAGAEGDEPILDLEGLQFEGAVEGE